MFNWNLLSYWPTFESSASFTNEIMQNFHDYTMMILVQITIFIFMFIIRLFMCNYKDTQLLYGQRLEMIWTITPILILLLIAYPSLFYLYLMDLSVNPMLTMKIYGAQWYWIYEYADFNNKQFNSYMLNDNDLLNEMKTSMWRLLEVDFRLTLPYNVETRILITSQDVIHSFAIPSLSLKVDAVPGRINWLATYILIPGSYYGQCSEICGVGHAFMPICIDAISPKDFQTFISNI